MGASDTVPTDGQCYQYTLTGTDNVGNTATFQTIVLVDTTGPAGGSLSYVDGLASLGSVSIDWAAAATPSPASPRSQIERATATLTGSTCGGFGGFSALGGPVGSSPTVDSSVAAGNCYAYRLVVTNNTGVSSTFTSPSVAKITNSSPITVSAGNPAGVYLGGTTVWVGPAAANAPWKLELTSLGQNGVTTATWDGKSAATFTSAPPTPTVANSAPFQSGTYTWDGTGTLTDTIHVIRDPGGTDDFVDVRSDTTDPSGSVSYPNATILTHSVPVSTSGDGRRVRRRRHQRPALGDDADRLDVRRDLVGVRAGHALGRQRHHGRGQHVLPVPGRRHRQRRQQLDLRLGERRADSGHHPADVPLCGDERRGHAADDQHERAARRHGDDAGRRLHGRL